MSLPVPGYRAGTLADAIPSLLAGFGIPDMTNVLDSPARWRCVYC